MQVSENNIDEPKTLAVNTSATEETNFRPSVYKDDNKIEDVTAVLPFDSGDVYRVHTKRMIYRVHSKRMMVKIKLVKA